MLKGASMEVETKENLRVVSGKMGDKNVEVFRDSGCKGVIVKREQVDETDFTGEVGYILTVDRTLNRVPFFGIDVDTPFYTKTIVAICMKDPLLDIIGNDEAK